MPSKKSDDLSPLLNGESSDDGNAIDSRIQAQRLLESQTEDESGGGFYRSEGSDGLISITQHTILSTVEQDLIICIFVVAFDTRSGNIIEWCFPEDFDLDGVEFKAMPSGAHTLNNDFIFFRKDNYFGLSSYQKLQVDSEIERGARMKSVGILATSYTHLYHHLHFLDFQVKVLLENPGSYEPLKAFYNDKKAVLPHSSFLTESSTSLSSPTSSGSIPNLKIIHPAGCFSQFILFFGARIFALWKMVLLRKRILFYSPPPVGVVCYRVYCCCRLGSLPDDPWAGDPQPYFYVNVADSDVLERTQQYVACTTEKIFETKRGLHDLYVDGQNLRAAAPGVSDILLPSSADKRRFKQLQQLGDDDDVAFAFFREVNARLFSVLREVSASQDPVVTNEHMKAMDLDPIGDREFLLDLVELLGVDIVLMIDNPCCPK